MELSNTRRVRGVAVRARRGSGRSASSTWAYATADGRDPVLPHRAPAARARKAWALVALAATVTLLAGCGREPVELVETRAAMTTEITVRVIAPNERTARTCLESAWREMEACALRLDRWTEASDIYKINEAAGMFHVNVDPLTVSCLMAAKDAWKASGGVFDPTVGPLLTLWREAEQRNRPPTDEELAAACRLVGMDKVETLVGLIQKRFNDLPIVAPDDPPPDPDELQRTIYTVGVRKGMELNVGGIAKGYIAGRMARRLRLHGATAGLVAAAGDIYAFGRRPRSMVRFGRDPRWGVAVQDPRHPDDRSRRYTAVHLEDQAIDTSGHYYRGYEIQGTHYSHIIDPRTGRPVDTRLASATVVAEAPALSDGLATAMAVLGIEKGLEVVESLDGVECLLLEWKPKGGEAPTPEGAPPEDADLVAHRSSGFAALEFDPAHLEPETPAPEEAPATPPPATPEPAPSAGNAQGG